MMILNYSLDQDDFLQYQLYVASKSERIKKQRRKRWLIMTFAFLALAVVFYRDDNHILMYYFLVAGTANLFFYPIYLRNLYKKHYKRYVNENFKRRFGEPCKVIFNENNIETVDQTGETKINLPEITEIDETANYFYLRIKSGGSLIISKSRTDAEAVRKRLVILSEQLKIEFISEVNWKWK